MVRSRLFVTLLGSHLLRRLRIQYYDEWNVCMALVAVSCFSYFSCSMLNCNCGQMAHGTNRQINWPIERITNQESYNLKSPKWNKIENVACFFCVLNFCVLVYFSSSRAVVWFHCRSSNHECSMRDCEIRHSMVRFLSKCSKMRCQFKWWYIQTSR